MRGLLGSFTTKLVLCLTILIVGLGLFYLAVALMTTKAHLQAIDQSLNLNVASRIADKHLQSAQFQSGSGLQSDILTSLMDVNPNAEIYVLDASGNITAHAAPPGKLKANAVAIGPVIAFVKKSQPLPVYGDDPRDPQNQKVFSAAALANSGTAAAYVYVVLGGEAYGSASSMFRRSYILRLSSALVAGSVLVALALGALSFYRLTAPLRQLAQTVSHFEPQNPVRSKLTREAGWQTDDEVGQLTRSFDIMAQRIADQIKMLKDSDTVRREFMMHISHDLKTPIASIQGYLETLLMKWDEMAGEQRVSYLESSLKVNDRIFNMVDAIFELSTLEGSNVPLRYETFSAAELVQDVCQKLQLEADKAEVTLAFDWQHPNVYLMGDIGLIERALVNVIENAIKFSDERGVVKINVQTADSDVLISVANRGQAIQTDDIEKIFLPFYRGKNVSQTIKGHGLGLPIAKRIVELHGGVIRVASTEAAGTVFTLALKA